MEIVAVALSVVRILIVAATLLCVVTGFACALAFAHRRFVPLRSLDDPRYPGHQVVAIGSVAATFFIASAALNWGQSTIYESDGWRMITAGQSPAFMADQAAQLTVAWGALAIAGGLFLLTRAVRKCRPSLFRRTTPSVITEPPTGAIRLR